MIFLFGFFWLITASFAFLLAILSPNWLTTNVTISNQNLMIRRSIFYICDILTNEQIYETVRCTSMKDYDKINEPKKLKYELAIASAAIAIGCAGLSIIAIYFSGFYFNMRHKIMCKKYFLLMFTLFILMIFLSSISVWILLLSEIATIGINVSVSLFSWPFWLAVASSAGYFLSCISILISFCVRLRRGSIRNKNLYRQENHF